jgi:mannosylglucosylglycerate synthase
MTPNRSRVPGLRIGFVSTRLAGTDGVSLETAKWARVLTEMGESCFYLAGEFDRSFPTERSLLAPEAHFTHPDILAISAEAFSRGTRPPELTQRIWDLQRHLKEQIAGFVRDFELDLLVAENVLSLPMNLPLGLALTEYIAETGIPVIGHHHDFYWERPRFLRNCVWDYLNMSFPPRLSTVRHVVINTSAAHQLSLRAGVSSLLIPNVMDFAHPPAVADGYGDDLRAALGIGPDEWLLLQPTRIVPRKGIEHAIELADRLGRRARLVITHEAGDEGYEYAERVNRYADLLGVSTIFAADLIAEQRGQTTDGRKIFTLADVYPQADIVTYPSAVEGFGNAFLEAIYYRRPVVVNDYTIFHIDIAPKGFQVIRFEGYVTDQTVNQARQVLDDPNLAAAMAEHNYRVAECHYSLAVLRRRLGMLLAESRGETECS